MCAVDEVADAVYADAAFVVDLCCSFSSCINFALRAKILKR